MALFRDDVELGKKDDDHKPDTRKVWRQRQLSHMPPRRTIKRFAILLIVVVGLWYFCTGMLSESSDAEEDIKLPHVGSVLNPKSSNGIATTTTSVAPTASRSVERNFNGPIKFFALASTLHAAERSGGGSLYNMNVVCVVTLQHVA